MLTLDAIGPPRAVVVVAHGLNLRAFALQPLFEPLRAAGATVVVVQFRGHALEGVADPATRAAWQSVRAGDWVDDLADALRHGVTLARQRHVGLTFIGYSLGALVYLFSVAIAKLDPVLIDRRVLIAPPVCIRHYCRLVLAFGVFGRRFMLPSFVPPDIRSHAETSVAAYQATFSMEATLNTESAAHRLAQPTTVLMDPKDELVSFPRLERWVRDHGLGMAWTVIPIDKGTDARSSIHHYMMDERSLGASGLAKVSELLHMAVFA